MEIDDQLAKYWGLKDDTKFFEVIEAYDKSNPMGMCSFIRFFKNGFSQKETCQKALTVARLIVPEKQSPILTFLFYLHWYACDNMFGLEAEGLIILGKMEACMDVSFPNSIKAEFLLSKAITLPEDDGILEIRKAISLMSPDSLRYKSTIATLMLDYSQGGRIKAFDSKYLSEVSEPYFNLFSFFNAVENGQTTEALKFKELTFPKDEFVSFTLLHFKSNSLALLNLYLGNRNVNKENGQLLSTKALMDKDPLLALSYAKEYYEEYLPVNIKVTNFSLYTPMRAQLANKNLDAAKLIIEYWAGQKQRYWFSDFFMARMELLNGNPDKAVKHFSRTLAFCKEFDAMGRLDFELELALELQPKQIRFLMSNATSLLDDNALPIEGSSPVSNNNIALGVNRIKGTSVAINLIKEEIKKFAVLDIPILILGETGVGKDVIANAIHEESNRKAEPFLAINCSAIAESLLLSELFGHEAGSYTGASKAHKGVFQEAGKGTVFLDEIGDISSGLQAALLRVLESGEYRPVGSAKPRMAHCRIIAATNALLESRVDAGTFRLDLLYRLKRLVIQVPPLRERPIDISFLSHYYLNLNKDPSNDSKLSQELESAFLAYAWPGNVRELKNEMEKIRLLHSGKSAYTLEDAGFLQANVKTEKVKNANSSNELTNKENNKKPEASSEEIFKKSGAYFRRLLVIKNLFLEHKTLSRKEICQISGFRNITIGNDLKILREENFIIKVEPTKSPRTHYFVLKEK